MTRPEGQELAHRLERLAGKAGAACLPSYRRTGEMVTKDSEFEKALRRFAAVADRRRLLIVFLLRRREELCACEIQAATGLTHSGVSFHMSNLTRAGLVRSRRDGKWVHYRLTHEGERIVGRSS